MLLHCFKIYTSLFIILVTSLKPKYNITIVFNFQVKAWLCLTCQVQQARKVAQPSEVTSVNSQISAKPTTNIRSPAKPDNKVLGSPPSPLKKMSVRVQPAKTEATNKPDGEEQSYPSQKRPQESQKASNPNKTPDQIIQTEHKAMAGTQKESGGVFGFDRSNTQPDAEKKAESVTAKMFGFGSSMFGSASALITSAVQDQSKYTPPASPKMSPVKEIKTHAVQNKDQEKKLEPFQQNKTPPLVEGKLDKSSTEPPKAAASHPNLFTCPLCKAALNIGSKNDPNYSTCTKCKTAVCTQCGFNPMPNVPEVNEIHLSCA